MANKATPELLAPAGSLDSLKAAVAAGADAVYFGIPGYNARMKAKNITPEELDGAFSLCALYGVKTNITLNTLLYGREFDAAINTVASLEKNYRPDAYIVQDLGLAAELKRRFPGITLHASTQAEVHNAFGLEVFRRIGFTRAVLARELTVDEIKAFSGCGMETEIFIHGAMCVCQSGGCLMSSLIGGRSGNRGECAYPCRLPYAGNSPYPLSLKDMCLAAHMPEILSLGVDALKIEGRMKPPSYVYEVTSLYRRLIDGRRAANADEMRRLAAVFSRSGFTDGYYTGKRGVAMFGVRSDDDKQNTRSVTTEIEERRLDVQVRARIKPGEPAYAEYSCRGVTASATGQTVQTATAAPLTAKEAGERLSKLGGTPFIAGSADVDTDGDAYLTVSSINALRRDCVSALTDALVSSRRRDDAPGYVPLTEVCAAPPAPGLAVRMGLAPNADALDACVRYEVPLTRPSVWKKLLPRYADKLCLVLPRTVYDSQADEVKALAAEAVSAGVVLMCLPNPSFLKNTQNVKYIGDICLNVTNTYTCKVLKTLGFSQITVSPEANSALAARTGSACPVYGRMPLMHTRNCIIRNISGCTGSADPHTCRGCLTDRTAAKFPIFGGYGHTNTIYNSVPLWLLDRDTGSPNPTIYFTDETPAEELRVIKAFFDRKGADAPFTRANLV